MEDVNYTMCVLYILVWVHLHVFSQREVCNVYTQPYSLCMCVLGRGGYVCVYMCVSACVCGYVCASVLVYVCVAVCVDV